MICQKRRVNGQSPDISDTVKGELAQQRHFAAVAVHGFTNQSRYSKTAWKQVR